MADQSNGVDTDAKGDRTAWPDFEWPDGGDFRLLARYVNQQSVRESGLALRQGEPIVDEALTSQGQRAVRLRAAQRLFDRMASRGRFRYDYEPFNEGQGQRIRGAWEAMRDKATCVDLALIYAGLCLTEGLYPLLVVATYAAYRDGEHGGEVSWGHVQVGVALDEDARDAHVRGRPLLDRHASEAPGLSFALDGQMDVSSAGALEAVCREHAICLIDTTDVRYDVTKTYTPSFDQATRISGEHLRTAHVIDVPWLLTQTAYRPYPPRKDGWSIHNRFTPGPEYHHFADRDRTLRHLQQASGLVVVYGPPGSGKSMLAREAAQQVDQGYGWELRADDPSTVAASLAAAEASEQGIDLEAEATERADRTSMAADAGTRLAGLGERYVVLADNADGDPGKVITALPTPGPNQLLLVTTTNPKWEGEVVRAQRQARDAELITLGPLPDNQLTQAFPHLGNALELLDGRPLLARAYDQFCRTTGRSPLEGAGHDELARGGDDEDEDQGALAARVLWQAARRELEEHGPETAARLGQAAALAAVLPPERVEHALLDRVAPRAAKRLYELGLVDTTNEPGTGFLHRLFGAAIRASGPNFDALLVNWYASGELHEVIDTYGSAPQVTYHADLLEAAAGSAAPASSAGEAVAPGGDPLPESDLGLALIGAGRLLELYGLTGRSARLYQLALPYLDAGQRDHRRPLAEAIHGINRQVNQEKDPGRDRLVAAIQNMDEAIELRQKHVEDLAAELSPADGDADRAYRMAQAETEASISLKVLMEAKVAVIDGDLETIESALDRLKESAKRRRLLLGDKHPLAIRGLYNVGGAHNRVGKARGEPKHFEEAMNVYDEVLQLRRQLHRRDDHPHVAACHHGKAIVRYNEAVYVTAPLDVQPEDHRREQQRLLDEAFGHASTALTLRQRVPTTPDALDDLAKSWSMLHKIARAQQVLADKGYEERQRALLGDAAVLGDELDNEIRRLLDLT